MRLWHEDLLEVLPKQTLQGQHRECCALRGKGWDKNHSTVQYALDDEFEKLIAYHMLVIRVLEFKHHVNVSSEWKDYNYRGKKIGYVDNISQSKAFDYEYNALKGITIYTEHNDTYMNECLDNLWGKMTGEIKRYNGEDYSDKNKKLLWNMFSEKLAWVY